MEDILKSFQVERVEQLSTGASQGLNIRDESTPSSNEHHEAYLMAKRHLLVGGRKVLLGLGGLGDCDQVR